MNLPTCRNCLEQFVMHTGDLCASCREKEKDAEISYLMELLVKAAKLLKGARCLYIQREKPHSPRCTNQATHFGVMNEGTYTYLSAHCDEHVERGLGRQTVFMPRSKDLAQLRIDEILAFAEEDEDKEPK